MNSITISEHNHVLVVDSRLIAQELGIEHSVFFKTIKRHEQSMLELGLGQIGFEDQTVQNSVGAKNQAKFAWLTDEQATFLMTLSRNTEQVIRCKAKLVLGFSAAKKRLEQPIEPTTQPLLPVHVNQSKVFIVGDDNGVKALVPHDQIERLLEIATLRKFKQTIDPIMFEGLDPTCLALPLELIEALNEQLQLVLKLSSKKSKPLGFGKSKK